MRETTRTRLDRLRASEWLGWAPAFIVLAGLIGAFVAVQVGAGDERRMAVTVESADWRLNDDTGQHYPHIEVKLDSGAFVRVGSLATSLPAIGDRITVRQRSLLFNYFTTYEWDGPAAPQVAPLTVPSPTPVSLP